MSGRALEALAYEAPFLVAKLLKERIVESPQEAEALFTEVKRYLVLTREDRSRSWDMYSQRVDEVWHQFILFAHEYTDFCERFFGAYVLHSPSNAPAARTAQAHERASFAQFRERYEAFYGAPLPDVWLDAAGVRPTRRILNDAAGQMAVREDGEDVALVDAAGQVLLSVNALAREALGFISRTGAFYVRELPGGLTDEEKVALIAALVEGGPLRLAP